MKIAEIFESIQGEGPEIGMRAVFVRLYGCNLKCEGCDTRYSWNGRYAELNMDDIEQQVYDFGIPNVIITGGEPLLQKTAVELLVKRLWMSGKIQYVGLETNGTVKRFKKELFSRVVVSPKRFSDLEWWLRKLDKSGWKTRLVVKIVANGFTWGIGRYNMNTLEEIIELLDHPRVYFMPEGITSADVAVNIERVVEWLKRHGIVNVKVTPRLHMLMGWR